MQNRPDIKTETRPDGDCLSETKKANHKLRPGLKDIKKNDINFAGNMPSEASQGAVGVYSPIRHSSCYNSMALRKPNVVLKSCENVVQIMPFGQKQLLQV